MTITIRHVAVAFALLFTLAGASWAISYLELGGWIAVAVALGIAALKIALVVLVFMELAQHRGGARIVAVTAVLFVGILTSLVLADVWTR